MSNTLEEAEKRLINIINKPKHKELKSAVLKKLPLLNPLENAISDYLAAYNFRPSGRQSFDDWSSESELGIGT